MECGICKKPLKKLEKGSKYQLFSNVKMTLCITCKVQVVAHCTKLREEWAGKNCMDTLGSLLQELEHAGSMDDVKRLIDGYENKYLTYLETD